MHFQWITVVWYDYNLTLPHCPVWHGHLYRFFCQPFYPSITTPARTATLQTPLPLARYYRLQLFWDLPLPSLSPHPLSPSVPSPTLPLPPPAFF